MGGEARRKGVNVLLGPVVGPAWTVVKGGRNWEGSSADPYLSGALSAETIRGIQQEHVITSTKVCDVAYRSDFSNGNSTTLQTSRKTTECLKTERRLFRPISMTAPCMRCIFGKLVLQLNRQM